MVTTPYPSNWICLPPCGNQNNNTHHRPKTPQKKWIPEKLSGPNIVENPWCVWFVDASLILSTSIVSSKVTLWRSYDDSIIWHFCYHNVFSWKIRRPNSEILHRWRCVCHTHVFGWKNCHTLFFFGKFMSKVFDFEGEIYGTGRWKTLVLVLSALTTKLSIIFHCKCLMKRVHIMCISIIIYNLYIYIFVLLQSWFDYVTMIYDYYCTISFVPPKNAFLGRSQVKFGDNSGN